MQFLSLTKKCNVNQLLLPKETPATSDIFHIPNLLSTLPETKLQLSAPLENTNNVQHYINSIIDTGTSRTMIVFTDGSTHPNLGLSESGVIIKKQVWNCTPIKIAKAMKCMGSSYEGEIEAIATEYAWDNVSPSNDSLHIFTDCQQSAILAMMSQNIESYYNFLVRAILENLMDISPKVENFRISYWPVHQGIKRDCMLMFMWQLKNISYFNIYKNVVFYLLKFITTLYQFRNFSCSLLYLVFY